MPLHLATATTGWYYKPGFDTCDTCTEVLTLECEYAGRDQTDQPAWVAVRDFCWNCEDPVPSDWEQEHIWAEWALGLLPASRP